MNFKGTYLKWKNKEELYLKKKKRMNNILFENISFKLKYAKICFYK